MTFREYVNMEIGTDFALICKWQVLFRTAVYSMRYGMTVALYWLGTARTIIPATTFNTGIHLVRDYLIRMADWDHLIPATTFNTGIHLIRDYLIRMADWPLWYGITLYVWQTDRCDTPSVLDMNNAVRYLMLMPMRFCDGERHATTGWQTDRTTAGNGS
jgi:hypothetical protein